MESDKSGILDCVVILSHYMLYMNLHSALSDIAIIIVVHVMGISFPPVTRVPHAVVPRMRLIVRSSSALPLPAYDLPDHSLPHRLQCYS